MEFFERAHVVKSKNSHRKDSKSEENVKKQLKQMLYGYQHSDNALIKDSDKLKNDLEDSSSVSGYSDLNLTNTSSDGDLTKETESTDYKDTSVNNNIALDDTLGSVAEKETAEDMESISEYSDELISLSAEESLKAAANVFNSESDAESDLSFIETSTDIDSTSNDESEFDADGMLAACIMKKLHGTTKDKKKSRKRKSDQANEDELVNISPSRRSTYKGPYMPEKDDSDINRLSIEMSSISLPHNNEYAGPYRQPDHDSEKSLESNETQEDNSLHSKDSSSPFVSVLATDIEPQSLSDVLGEYRHPTIKNLPSDSQTVLTTDSSNIFRTQNVSLIDIQNDDDDASQQEDLCSLIPEVDEDLTVKDIELEESGMDIVDESTSYDKSLETEITSERETSPESLDHALVNPVQVYYGKNNYCIFILKHPIEIYIHGKVKVNALGGSVEVLGYLLQDKVYEIYAPNYNYAQCVKTVENHNACYGLFGKLTAAGLSVSEAEEIVTSIGEYDGVICMEPLKSRQMDFVESNFTATDLFSKQSKNTENCFKEAAERLGCSLYLSRPWKCFQVNSVWKQVIKSGLDIQSRGVVCGGKGVGKSTFLRYYVNKQLASGPVLVVDLDPGQPEMTVAGNVSATVVTRPLLGPGFTHLHTPEIMLNIGMINTMDNPRRYAAAVKTLLRQCTANARLKSMAWIVNTMGMTNTIGLKFITLIILQVQPTFLLQIDSKNAKKNYDFHLYPQTVKNLYFEDYQTDSLFRNIEEVNLDYAFFLSHHADNGVKNNYSLAPKEERYLNFLAYFGLLLNVTRGDLLGIVPYEVSLKDLKIGGNVKINKSAVTRAINGKVVALCECPPNYDSVFTLADAPLTCFGAGLIRGVDWDKEVLYVLTSEPIARLEQASCLVYADWVPELRGAALTSGPPFATPLPYRTAALYQQRQLMFAPKRRFNPLQLLKMSRSS